MPLQDGALPPVAERIAQREGVQVVAVALREDGRVPADRVRKALAAIRRTLGEVLLVAADESRSQLHFVYPGEQAGREVLRRTVVYRGQPRRTVAEQLAGIYAAAERGDLRAALDRAYDVEPVTREFFKEYKRVFDLVMGQVRGLPDEDERKLFCQTLFNRLMFLYFLQRKGWLTFGGDENYLAALWKDAQRQGDANFYDSRLKLLFFSALSNARSRDDDRARKLAEPLIGRVPFLNGGLFDQTPLDKRPGVVVPDTAIRAILHDLFARFNFTIAESTPYDVQVAVDPEMLGKVFEELVTGRHESGSYYTPRPIVAFMCREALKHYLPSRVPGLTAEQAAAFVDGHGVTRLNQEQARRVLDALETIAVVDPACGSGAYLLGMLHELLELQHALYSSDLIYDAQTLYDLKLRTIERNIYGVDIDPFAVNIAMLRLWLSLVIDYAGPGDPPALPNLGFKIVRGDSLLAPDPQAATTLFRNQVHKRVAELAHLKAAFMRETGEAKRELQRQIEDVEAQIGEWLGHDVTSAPAGSVDWRVQFAEVFDARGGFDVVLANPPYVRQELIREIKPALKRAYGELLYSGTADLYVYFYYRALQLLRPKGMLVFISSNKWFRAAYGAKLRAHMAKGAAVLSITDFGDLPVFEAATAYPMIFVAQKGGDKVATRFTQVKSLAEPYPDVRALIEQSGQALPPDALNGENWSLTDNTTAARLRTMATASIPLGDYVNGQIYYGIKTGFNAAFDNKGRQRDELIADDPKSAEIIKPFAGGRDVRRWRIDYPDKWVIFARRGIQIDDYPAIRAHLAQWKAELTPKRTGKEEKGRKPGRYKWYEVQDDVAYYPAFEKPKIVFPDITKEPRFAFDSTGGYVDTTIFVIPVDDLYLLGVLNSEAVLELYVDMSPKIRGGYLRYKRQYVERIPIPQASAADRTAIADLVRQCLDTKGQGPRVAEWEAEFNARVARLYGLAAD